MGILKKIIYLFLLLAILSAQAAFAASGTTAASFPEGIPMASGAATGTSYTNFSSAGETSGSLTGTTYYSWGGLAATIYAPSIPSADAIVPRVQNIKFDGYTIKNNDYVAAGVTITAALTDESGIDTAASSIEVDGAFTKLNALTSPSTFDATTGALTYKPTFAEGAHTLKIYVFDLIGNMASSESITFKVSAGDLQITGTVLNYPNPFAPPTQSTKIGYMLNKDSDIKVYIFNMVSQLIKKFEIISGSQGARAGYNELTWDGNTDFGEVASNDVYFCKVTAGGKVLGKCKIVVLK